jgi:hypothetical protein
MADFGGDIGKNAGGAPRIAKRILGLPDTTHST